MYSGCISVITIDYSLFLSLSLTCQVNTLVCTILLWSNKCPSPQCFFYTGSGWPKFAYVTNPVPPETRRMTNKLRSQWHSCFRFSIHSVLYTQDTFTPFSNFEDSHFACHWQIYEIAALYWQIYEIAAFHRKHQLQLLVKVKVLLIYSAKLACIHADHGLCLTVDASLEGIRVVL